MNNTSNRQYQIYFEMSGEKTVEVFNRIQEKFPNTFTHKRSFYDGYGNRLESYKTTNASSLYELKVVVREFMNKEYPALQEMKYGDPVLEKFYDFRFYEFFC
jgi:hypothetical protein